MTFSITVDSILVPVVVLQFSDTGIDTRESVKHSCIQVLITRLLMQAGVVNTRIETKYFGFSLSFFKLYVYK